MTYLTLIISDNTHALQESSSNEDGRLVYGVSAMQGWRIDMEDAHVAVLDLVPSDSPDAKKHQTKLSIFGVFDGHGGHDAALFAGNNLHEIIQKQTAFQEGNYEQALRDGFLDTDQAILNGGSHILLRMIHIGFAKANLNLPH